MRYFLAFALMLAATPTLAQDAESPGFFGRLFGGGENAEAAEEDPGGYLERLIEDNLSGEGRDVRIRGFEGLLGGTATLETLTISDSEGVWLTISDATLDWSRTALLRGRLEVNELSAASIEFTPPMTLTRPAATRVIICTHVARSSTDSWMSSLATPG